VFCAETLPAGVKATSKPASKAIFFI
jgi:hypothetical protein